MLRAILLTGLGGGLGSILRYMASVAGAKFFPVKFPVSTFIVNILGSFIIGLILGIIDNHQLSGDDLKYFLIFGFCGGFTTFSAFATENYNLFNSGNSYTALLYIASSVIVSLIAAWFGLSLTKL